MSNAFLSLFIAAGVAGFAYSKLGRRVGYGNNREVVTIVAVAFVLSYIFVFTFLKFVLHF